MRIETDRLVITEFTTDMAEAVRNNSTDEDNRRFVPDEVWETVEEAEETLEYLISRYGTSEGPLVYPILLKETNANIGYVQLCPLAGGGREIGYHVAKKYTGNGYATEAVKAFLPVIAREADVREICGVCLAENRASAAILRKCGFETVYSGPGFYQDAEREIVKAVWRTNGGANNSGDQMKVNDKMTELRHCGTKRIETERLVLRPFTAEDAEAMFRNWASSAEVTRYLTWPPHTSPEGTRALLEDWAESYRDPAVYHWGIVLKSIGEVIGDVSVVRMNEKAASAELGWCMGEAWWGQGIMPEAALAVRDYLFDRAGFLRLESRHDKNNPKSGRVMQKIGMRCEGTQRAADVNNQGICDVVLYAVLREDRENGSR